MDNGHVDYLQPLLMRQSFLDNLARVVEGAIPLVLVRSHLLLSPTVRLNNFFVKYIELPLGTVKHQVLGIEFGLQPWQSAAAAAQAHFGHAGRILKK